MVLLKGLNYDYTGQVSSKIITAAVAAGVALILENTEGLADDDYIVIAPGTETAEIVRIDAAVASDTVLVITALKFDHAVGVSVFRLPFNQMQFYESATVDGTYIAIANSTTDMDYSTNYTNFDDTTGDIDYYFKRTFYNENTAVESDIDLSNSWQTDDESLYITPEQLRTWIQFDENDYPNHNDMRSLIALSQDKMTFDFDSSDPVFNRIALFLLSRSMVLRSLATRSLSKGYITINAEGRQVTKAHQELVLEAENTMSEYKEFVRSILTSEVASTNFMDNTTIVGSLTRQRYIDILTGTQNAIDSEFSRRFYGSSRSGYFN
jgi:hypothetical protein